MMIVCPNCTTSYQVEPSSLGAAGRSVRCARCKKTWFAANPQAAEAISHSQQSDIAAFAAAPSARSVTHFIEPKREAVDFTPAADFAPVAPEPVEAPAPVPAADHPAPQPFDAQPEPAPSVPDDPPLEHQPESPPSEDIETAAARRMRRDAARRRSQWAGSRWSTAILALVAINAGLIGWRTDIVRFVPQTASLFAAVGLPVNLRGLEFSEIVTRKETQDGVQMLVVEGTIKSNSRRIADVPRLRFAVRNTRGQEIYSWTALPARNVLAPGATLPFRSRLASPPPEAHAVLVRFFNRRDLVAGIQ